MKKKKKLRLKKQGYILIGVIIILIVGTFYGIKLYKEYQYKQTYEYKLTSIGYSIDDAKMLQEKTNNEILDKILNMDYNENIIKIISAKYFLLKNFDTYLEYQKKEDEKEIDDIIALVNTHAMNQWYEQKFETNLKNIETMLVNKFYYLNKDYSPKDLKNISLDYSYGEEGDNKLIEVAYNAFLDMWNKAHEEGFYFMVTSSYRTYEEQESIYEERKTSLGERKADQTAARPGHSEHQTGLVVDMTSKTEPQAEEFSESKGYAWLKEHAYEFGFIERYPEGKTYITGYEPESWHWRYVGKKAAKVIQEENITFDEYYAYYLEK